MARGAAHAFSVQQLMTCLLVFLHGLLHGLYLQVHHLPV
jgi:uncharacterized membrane protein YqaE (UPF0057 family)